MSIPAEYSEALEYSNQSLILFRAINDRKEEAKMLNNISLIYQAQGAYDHALDSLEQCLPIWQEIGNKQGQGATLNNIAAIHYSKGEYDKALEATIYKRLLGLLLQGFHLRVIRLHRLKALPQLNMAHRYFPQLAIQLATRYLLFFEYPEKTGKG
ncbi:MAG: hypothetical protein D3917_14095 [Candidatus Electrothrix sp. AX5]|nr:hypothetical protein [Candidatus Electrothrix sp. AX5]